MVHERTPIAVRVLTIFLALVAAGTAGSGGLKSCNYGQELYQSGKQVYFLIVVGALVAITFTLRVLVFDVRKLRLPRPRVFVLFDSVWLVLSFASAVAVSAAPVGTSVCSGLDKDIMILLEEVCEFKCSNIVTAIIAVFMASVCILFDILFTTGAIPVMSNDSFAEDFSFDEKVGTPRSQKAAANRGAIGV